MYVEKYGAGTDSYVGLHGWGGGRNTFAPLLPLLPAQVSFHAVDLPGYGRSPAPRAWSAQEITEELIETICMLEAKPLTVIGNCSGAILAILAAKTRPELFKRLVLIDPFAYVPWYFKLFVAQGWGRYAYYSTFANPLGRWLTNLSLKARRTTESDLTQSFKAVNHDVAYRYLGLLAGLKDIEGFGSLTMPIEIVYGERTFRAVKQSADLWQKIWPRARRWELKGAGHLPIVEATAQLCSIIFEDAVAELCAHSSIAKD